METHLKTSTFIAKTTDKFYKRHRKSLNRSVLSNHVYLTINDSIRMLNIFLLQGASVIQEKIALGWHVE